MRKLILIYLLYIVSGVSPVSAQKYDNTWLWGAEPQLQDSFIYAGNGEATFPNNIFFPYSKFRNTVFFATNTSVSDGNGNLLFFTNGMRIKDTTNNVILNGDSINHGQFWEYCKNKEEGLGLFSYYVPYSHFFLPQPENDSIYYLFHIRGDTVPPIWKGSVCYSVVKRQANGAYEVILKNQLLSNLRPTYGGVSACKHGNGRDWWISFNQVGTNCVHFYLLNSDSLSFSHTACLGEILDYTENVKSYFSLDGSCFVKTGSAHGTDIFRFNRCEGELIFFTHLSPIFEVDSASGGIVDVVIGSEVSSMNKFLYVNTAKFVFQYDLDTIDIEASLDTVGVVDNFIDTLGTPGPYYFNLTQFGPDGKIYIAARINCRWMSTIERPDSSGQQCNVIVRSTLLPRLNGWSIPYFPNYRLGRMLGSACDTIYNDIHPIYTQTPWLKVYPNPATDIVRFDYNWLEWEKITDAKLQIIDLQGIVAYQQALPKYSTRQDVTIKQLATGVYTVSIQDGNKKIAVSKLTKVE